MQGSGRSEDLQNYEFIDEIDNIRQTLLYYRLKQPDIDGTHSYSDIRAVSLETLKSVEVDVHPNPAAEYLKIKTEASNSTIRLLDMNGRSVFKGVNLKEVTISLNGTHAGMYLVEVVTGYQRVVKRVIIE
jgi:hypothetical protein